MEIKFRESRPAGMVTVIVIENGEETVPFKSSEYRGAATWARDRYGLSDDQLMAIYRDYKDDLDAMDDEEDGEIEDDAKVDTATGSLVVTQSKYMVLPGSQSFDGEGDTVLLTTGICLPDYSSPMYIKGDVAELAKIYSPETSFDLVLCHQRELIEAGDPTAVFGYYNTDTGRVEPFKNAEPAPEPKLISEARAQAIDAVLAVLRGEIKIEPKTVETDVEPITHFDFNGHNGFEIGVLYDLTKVPDPKDYNEKWRHEHWTEVAERFLRTEARCAAISSDRQRDVMEEMLAYASTRECGECGCSYTLKRQGTTLVANTTCEHPGGIKPYDVLLNVPSGKIVFANDLRSLTLVEDNFDVNYTIGQVHTTKAYAEDGMAHVFVGNTCPGVYRTDEGLAVQLHNGRYDENGNHIYPEEDDTIETVPESLGGICTDLWWYSAMDHDLFMARCAETGEDPEDFGFFTVEVEPGVYAFSDELADRDASGTVNLSRIRKVEAEAPVLKQRATGPAASLVESGFWREVEKVKRYCKDNRNFALGEICTVLGNGYRWHKGSLRDLNGHDDDTPFRTPLESVETPRPTDFVPTLPGFQPGFRVPGMFYPLYWNYPKLGDAPLDADPYWIAGGMMFLKSAINSDYKMLGEDQDPPEQVQTKRDEHHAVMIASLDVLCEIAEQRGLVQDGTLARIFAEIGEAWV